MGIISEKSNLKKKGTTPQGILLKEEEEEEGNTWDHFKMCPKGIQKTLGKKDEQIGNHFKKCPFSKQNDYPKIKAENKTLVPDNNNLPTNLSRH